MTTPRKFYEGYEEARKAVSLMSREQLYSQIDALYGRGQLSDNPSDTELRREAQQQTALDWLNPEHPDYQTMIKLNGGKR